MSTKVKLKKSSIVGRVPSVNDLDYGEIAINYADGRIYYKSSSNSINYFQDFNNALAGFDSADVFGIIDSAYIQNRQNLEYSSLIGIPTSFTPNGVDSSATFALIDSDYIATRANLAFAGTADITNYQFVADSGDITFTGTDVNGLTLSFNNQLVQVYLNGILLLENDDYTKSNNNTIILSSPADSGDQLIVSDFNAFFTNQTVTANTIHGFIDSALASVGEADITAFEFTADSGQTAFSGIDNNGATLSLDPTGVQVYLNGILLSGASDYTVSANTLTLTDGASLNSHLSVQSFKRYFNFVGLDSADITGIVDATYIQANQTAQDFAYASLTGVPTTFAPIGVDSASTIALIDSAYIAARTPEVVATDLSDYRTETQIKALIDSGVNAVIDAAPGALDTLNELAAALGDDANFSTTITNQIATKIDSAGVVGIVDAAYVQSRQTAQDFAYTSLTGAPNVLDSADVLALAPASNDTLATVTARGATTTVPVSFNGTGNSVQIGDTLRIDENGSGFRMTNVGAFDNDGNTNFRIFATNTLYLRANGDTGGGIVIDDSNQDVAIDNNLTVGGTINTHTVPTGTGTLALTSDLTSYLTSVAFTDLTSTPTTIAGYGITDAFDGVYSSLTGAPNVLDSADVLAIVPAQTPQDFAYASLTGAPNVLDSAAVATIAGVSVGTDSAAIEAIIDSNYVASRVTLAYAGNAEVKNYKFIADSNQTIFTGADENAVTLGFTNQLVQVYLNGVLLLDGDDYTKSNNNTITLTQGASVGDQLIVSDFKSFFASAGLDSADITNVIDTTYIQANQTAQDFAYSSLTGAPNVLDSADVLALAPAQDFAYSSLTGAPNVLDSNNVSALITTSIDNLIDGAPGALDTLNELATALNDDSNAIAAINNTLALKLNIADVTPQDFSYASLTGVPTTFAPTGVDSGSTLSLINAAYIQANQTPQDFAYASLTGAPNVLDSADVLTIANAAGGVDSAAIEAMIDSNYVASRVTLAYAGNAQVQNTKFIADSNQTIFTGLSYADQLVQVYLNGVLLLDSDDYTKSGNDTITLTQPVNLGDQLIVSDFNAFFTNQTVDSAQINSLIDSALGTVGRATVKNYKFIADSGDTTFTGTDANGLSLSYNSQLVQVYLNGLLLTESTDYTKSGNDTITLISGADSGDELSIVDFNSFFTYSGFDSADVLALQTPQDFAYSSLTGAPNVLDSADVLALAPAQDFAYSSLTGAPNVLDSANVLALQTPQDFAYSSLTGAPNILDSANVLAIVPVQDFAYASLTGTPNVLDSANVSTLITTAVDALVDGAPGALNTLNELATALNDDSNAIAAINNTLALKLNIADVTPQDFAYSSLTGAPNVLDSADVLALAPAQDFAYSSLTGAPNVLDSGDVSAIAAAIGGVDSAAIEAMIDSNYVASRVSLAYAGNASVQNYKFIADSGQTAFTGLSYSDQFVQVYLNGVLLLDSDDYTKSGNDTITLITGADSGDQLIVSDFTSFFTNQTVDSAQINSLIDSALDNVGRATVTNYKFIADSAQTTFTGTDANGLSLSYSNQLVQVYLNGVLLLDSDDYTKSGNDTITLATTASSGDQLIIADYKSFFTSSGFDSAGILSFIDQDYIRNNQTTYASLSEFNNDTKFLDSNTVTDVIDAAYIQANQTTQDFAYSSLTGVPNVLDSADVLSLSLDASEVTSLVDSAYVQARQTPQDFAYSSLTGTPTTIAGYGITDAFDGAYSSLTGTPNVLDSADVTAIANAAGGVDSAAIEAMIDSNYVASRVTLAYAGNAEVKNYKFVADSAQTVFTGADENAVTLGFTNQLVQVYLNGVLLLDSDDYTKSNNNTITLVTPANLGDQLIVSDFKSFFASAGLDSADITNVIDTTYIQSNQTPQDFAYSSLTGTPNVLDSANVSTLITTAVDALVDGAPGALDTLNELATALNDDSNAIAAINNTLALKLNIADVVPQDFAYSSLTGVPTAFAPTGVDSGSTLSLINAAYIQANQTPQDFTYSSLTGAPNVLDSADVTAIATAAGGVDSAAIEAMIDSNYVASRVTLAYAGNAEVKNYKFVADSAQTIFTGADENAVTLGFTNQLVQVYLNGVLLLDSDDYVKSNNDTITLVTPANLGDQLIISDFKSFFASAGLDSADITNVIDATYIQSNQTAQDFAYSSLTGAPNILDSADVLAIAPAQDFAFSSLTGAPTTIAGYGITDAFDGAYSSLTGAPNVLDSSDVTNVVDATYIQANQTAQDFAYSSLTGTPNVLDSADVLALAPAQDFAYSSLTGAPNVLDSADVLAIANAAGGVDSAAIEAMIDSNYVASRVSLAYAGNAQVQNTKFIADSAQTVFTGLSYADQFVQVYLNGVLLLDSDDYVKSGNDTITLITGAASGDQLIVSDFKAFFTNQTVDSAQINSLIDSALGSVGRATVTNYKFVADSGDTIFTGTDINGLSLSYNNQLVQVYLNGLLLTESTDYTKTGNDTITLVGGADSGDELSIVDFNSFFTYNGFDSAGITSIINASYIQANQTAQDFAYSSLTGAPNVLDSADVLALAPAQDFAYSSLTGAPNVLDSADVLALAPGVDSASVLSIASAPRVYTSSTTHTVTVASKTSGNKYFNVGSSNAFFIDGIETPYIQLTPGQTYVFDQADTSNSGHPLRFYYDEDKVTEYSSGVTVTGTAGNAGANTTIVVDDDTPARLYYLCQFHSNMGWAIGTDTHNTTGLDTDGLTEGSTNQYFTTARARAALSGGTGVTLSSGQISIGQPVGTSDNVTFSNITATGSLSVTGTNAFLSTSNLQVNDNIITLNADETGTPSDNVGFEVERGTASNVSLIWAEDSDQWQITTDGSNFYKILTTNDNITADDVALLNGESASYYLDYTNFTNKPASITDFSISDGTAGQVLTTDGSGNFSFTTVSGSGGGGVNGNNIVTEHKLTSSGTAAYLTAAGSYSTVQVFVNGVLARDSDDYVFNDSNGYVTFASAPPSGSEIMIFGHKTSTLDVDSDNNLSLTAGLNVGNHSSYTSSTSTNSTSNEATIDTFDGASVRGAKYVITAEDQSGNYQISEALVVHDGTTATITTYGTINTGSGNIAIFDAEYSGGNVLIKATPTTSNTTYKIVRTDVVI